MGSKILWVIERRFIFLLSFASIFLTTISSLCYGAQHQVPSSFATIQAAIDAASNDDEVVVSNGTYNENINFNGKAITVRSVNGAASTIIDGGGSGNVVTFETSTVGGASSVLNGFTIQNGATGIYCNKASFTISNCIITNNTGANSGIYGQYASFTLTNITIINNTGWALYNYPSGDGSLVLSGGLIDSNGGGLVFYGATVDVSKSIFTNNSNTGLKFSATGAANITNSLFAQNDSLDRAGGIWVAHASSVNVMNCTIADNTAQKFYGSGGIYMDYADASKPPLTITNSILTQNKTQTSYSYNIYPNTYQSRFEISYTMLNQSLYSQYGPGNIYTSVWFVDSANGDYHLGPNSYNIDAGTSVGAPAEDLDGNSRPQNGVFDMGAYEFTCPPDGDGDGYSASEGCGNYPADCNDSNSSIHPGKAENCSDGIDNDCDGDIDGADTDCSMSCIDYVNSDDNPYGCSTGLTGSCYPGTRVCNGDGSWGDCNQDNQPTTEVCDNTDNDCDGRFNEGLNLSSCSTGLPGECAEGITRCNLSNTVYSLVCDPLTPATTETCDGFDNDCDGTVDNDVSTACPTGLPGICALGTMTCDVGGTGTWSSCIQDNQAVTETCDGQDNDCDGDVDEGFDSDGDGTADCFDGCPDDPNKIASGTCGCGVADTDTDGDGTADCGEECPNDPNKLNPGLCGCGVADCPQLPLIDPDANTSAALGTSVAISDNGTIAVVGAPYTTSEPYGYYGNEYLSAGRVLIYQWDGYSWNFQQQLELAQPYNGYLFGSSVSISGDGSTILVGANRESITWANEVNRPGLAHVYVLDSGSWTLQADLVASDYAHYDDFGISTALSHDGNTAVVGASGAEEGGDATDRGAAYVFVRNGTTWSQQQRLKGTGTHTIGEHFGSSTALSDDGNTLVVGAEKGVMDATEGFTYYGLAYVFTRNETVWTQEDILRASDYALQEQKFGHSASISGDGNTALIGKPEYSATGEAYIFTRTDSTWSEQQILTPSDSTSGYFGGAVSLSRDAKKAIIGARLAKTNGDTITGAAYVFTNNGTTWSELHKHYTEYGQTGDYYGTAVAISDATSDGFTALAGASKDDAGGHLDQGAMYVFPTIIDSTNPTRGATGVSSNTDITITFDQSMNGATINNTAFTLTGDTSIPGTVSYDDTTKTATFNPLSSLNKEKRYVARLTGIENADGNVMVPFSWSFTTKSGFGMPWLNLLLSD